GRRRCRGLPLPGAIDPALPAAKHFCRHDARRGLWPCDLSADERRHRRAPFGLALVIATLAHLTRLSRAGFVFAREGVLALADPARLPLPARTALALARLIE